MTTRRLVLHVGVAHRAPDVGPAAELLDVDVDHLAGQGLLIADDRNFRIEVGEAAQPLGLAGAGHGRARQPGLAGDF